MAEELKIETWATLEEVAADYADISHLYVETPQPLPTLMKHSVATGRGLVSNGKLGVDLIHVGAGGGFVPHTHPGDHILIVVGGFGTITFDGAIYPTQAGQLYRIDGLLPHAVGARTDHMILAVGSPHKAVDDEDRMAPVEYQAVIADQGDMTCRVCDPFKVARFPVLLHELGCDHCSCFICVSTGDEAEDTLLRKGLEDARR